MEELISVPETAKRLGVTRSWILRLCNKKRIPGARKIGRDWMIPVGARIEPTGLGRPLRTLEIPRAKKGGKR